MLDINKINKKIIFPSIIGVCYLIWLSQLISQIITREGGSLWSISVGELSLVCYYSGLLLLSFTLRGPVARFMMFGIATCSIIDHQVYYSLVGLDSALTQSAIFQFWLPVVTFSPIVLFLYKMYDVHIGAHIVAAKVTRKTPVYNAAMNAFNNLGVSKYRKPMLLLFGAHFLIELTHASLSTLSVFQYYLQTGEFMTMSQYEYGLLSNYDIANYTGIYRVVMTSISFFSAFVMLDMAVSSIIERVKFAAQDIAQKRVNIFQ